MQNYIAKALWRYFYHDTDECISLNRNHLPYWELTMVFDGSLQYTVNGEAYQVKKNDVILIPYGSSRTREGGSAAEFASFNFTLLSDVELPTDIYFSNMITSDMKNITMLFVKPSLPDPGLLDAPDAHYQRAKATNILNYILWELISIKRSKKYSLHVGKAIQYINENLFKPITLTDVSKSIHLSKEYTANLFKREIGKTVTEYINDVKMRYAKDMIQDINLSLSEIASTLGYENYSYFSRIFSNHFNISPIKFRRSLKNRERIT